jgi:Flp pilus assembly protein TadG
VNRTMFRIGQDHEALRHFGQDAAKGRVRRTKGQALVEFALMVPFLFLLIIYAVNFGGFIYDWITVANAARSGAQYAALGDSSAHFPTLPRASDVIAMIRNETSSLPNASTTNPDITVCQNNSLGAKLYRAPTTACPAATAPPLDTEIAVGTSPYTTVAVDVTYTFSPFFSAFRFPRLGIGLIGMPTTIHRRAVMRILD